MHTNVLILDNQTVHIETLGRGLRMEGYSVYAATNVQEALTYLRGEDPNIDLIITDDATILPNSAMLINQIVSGERHIPVIMMTAGKAFDRGINPLSNLRTVLLEKPFDATALLQAVEICMRAVPFED
jgi:DNA-binding NtrC family response regulator